MNCPVPAGAGLSWRFQDGEAAREEAIGRLLSQAHFMERAKELGTRLRAAGGWNAALDAIQNLVKRGST